LHGLSGGDLRIELLSTRRLSVALRDPFVIATGRVDATRAVEICARVVWSRGRATGLGEGACLPPVTREDQDDVVREVNRAGVELADRTLVGTEDALLEALALALPDCPVARAGVETAVLDAMARCVGVPLRTFLGGTRGNETRLLDTDVTIAIASPERMGGLAREWFGRGFRALKIKVGKDVDSDVRALAAVARAAPSARLRIDANAGYRAMDAIALERACNHLGFAGAIECWEQPCAADDLEGMREVARAFAAPVIADESVKHWEDLRELVRTGYADGINLKIAKMAGPLLAYRMGLAAQVAGLKIMAGGMVETRLGMTAAAHVACALGGVDFVDLDTALLLVEDPYEGGYADDGPQYIMPETPGLAVRAKDAGA
jgi:L-Ala-D/L-Glu epimerase / N-acetyl-D-glutamate racemase